MDTVQAEKAVAAITNAKKIIITMHERMDGDDGGAGLALSLYLRSVGKEVTHFISGGVPGVFKYLPQWQTITSTLEVADADLLIICGCSTKDRCGSEVLTNSTIPVLNIDHHPDNTIYGNYNLVDANKSAVSELMFDLFSYANWKISPDIATCLLTGIISDTGSFMHSNTDSSAFKTAGLLLKKGANLNTIIGNTFRGKSLLQMKAWGETLQNISLEEDSGMVYAIANSEHVQDLENLPQATFDGIVETINKVPNAKFALFLRQEGNKVKGSLRSDPFKQTDVNAIAKKFGGGGHKYASGFAQEGVITEENKNTWTKV